MGNNNSESNYEKLGSKSDVANINAGRTDQFLNQLLGLQNQFQTGMGQYGPEAAAATLGEAAPQLQQIAQNTINPYANQANSLAELMGQRASQNAASMFSGSNALNSGAALSAITRGYTEPLAQAQTGIAQMQSQLGGGLLNQLMNQIQGAYQTQGGLYGQTVGLQGALSAPEWWQPTYAEKKS